MLYVLYAFVEGLKYTFDTKATYSLRRWTRGADAGRYIKRHRPRDSQSYATPRGALVCTAAQFVLTVSGETRGGTYTIIS